MCATVRAFIMTGSASACILIIIIIIISSSSRAGLVNDTPVMMMRGSVPQAVKRRLFTESGPYKSANWRPRLRPHNARSLHRQYTVTPSLIHLLPSATVPRVAQSYCLLFNYCSKPFLLNYDWRTENTFIT